MGIFYFLSKKKLSLKHRKYQKTEFTGEMGAMGEVRAGDRILFQNRLYLVCHYLILKFIA